MCRQWWGSVIPDMLAKSFLCAWGKLQRKITTPLLLKGVKAYPHYVQTHRGIESAQKCHWCASFSAFVGLEVLRCTVHFNLRNFHPRLQSKMNLKLHCKEDSYFFCIVSPNNYDAARIYCAASLATLNEITMTANCANRFVDPWQSVHGVSWPICTQNVFVCSDSYCISLHAISRWFSALNVRSEVIVVKEATTPGPLLMSYGG